MADKQVEFVSGSQVDAGTATSIYLTTPPGNVGDLVLFFVGHDDWSDGEITASGAPIVLTNLYDGSPQGGDDSRQALFWGKEDQTAGRIFEFVYDTAEGCGGVCIRLSGQHVTTPIEGSALVGAGPHLMGSSITSKGAMFVNFIGSDSTITTGSPPTNWTERTYGGNSTARALCHTRSADTYPFPMAVGDLDIAHLVANQGDFNTIGIRVAPVTSTANITGTVKDDGGTAVSGAEVQLKELVLQIYNM